MQQPLNIFLGYDQREHVAYMVAKHSIERRASVPVLITPLNIQHLGHFIPPPLRQNGRIWDIESEAFASTEFARSRFCVPFLQRDGWALFADSDILCLTDIAELFELADDRYAIMCVKHPNVNGSMIGGTVGMPNGKTRNVPLQQSSTTKMDGQVQQYYERKNWSSVVLWNCSHPAHYRLTRERLNRWPGRDLHAFRWLEEDEIGELPHEWNFLVGIDSGLAKILHYTLGTPDIPGYENCDFADLWRAELGSLRHPEPAARTSFNANIFDVHTEDPKDRRN